MSSLISPFLWSFLPSHLTSIILPYLTQTVPSLFPPCPPNTTQAKKNHRNVYTLLIFFYICYNIYSGSTDPKDDYYALLGVSRGIDDEGLKRAYRTLSRVYHPDRAGSGGEHVFIAIRSAYEVLSDPVKRYAYDRFGPDVVGWKGKSVKELVYTGLFQSVGFYIISGGFMFLLNLTGRATHGIYWRQALFILLLSVELSLVLQPTAPPQTLPFPFTPLSPFSPQSVKNIPQFIWIRYLHVWWTSGSIAISQLAGLWSDGVEGDDVEGWNRVSGLLRAIEAEAAGQFHKEVIPILSSSADPIRDEDALISGIEKVMLDATISSHPTIRPIWQAALQRTFTPRTEKDGSNRHLHHGSDLTGSQGNRPGVPDLMTLQLAIQTPLPPSPPSSPRRRSMRL